VSYTIVLRPKAEEAIDEAAGWYEAQNPRTARAFRISVENALEKATRNPHQFPQIRAGLRRVIVAGFPYSLLFRVIRAEVVVTTCVHFRRHPRHWRAG
jgi:plasmid stabilization system protein ParE